MIGDDLRVAAAEPDLRTLAGVARAFARRRSPKLIALAILALAAVRVAFGDPSWRDAVAVAAMLCVYPFAEWAIHVNLLHMPPFELAGRRFEAPAARAHRAHHERPNDLSMILLDPLELVQLLLLVVPAVLAAGALAVGLATGPVPLGALLSAGLAGYLAIGVYEWTHFLIHAPYRPRSPHYRALWRNHRLHHFKNEHYWHGITQRIGDRVLGTDPDQREVARSATARTLDPRSG